MTFQLSLDSTVHVSPVNGTLPHGPSPASFWHRSPPPAKAGCPPRPKRAYVPRPRDRSTPKKWLSALLPGVRKRAKAKGLPVTITVADLELPEFCPITGQKLIYGGWNDWNAASLDRIHADKGYVPGNVRVLSRYANMLRFTCTDPAIFRALADDAERIAAP